MRISVRSMLLWVAAAGLTCGAMPLGSASAATLYDQTSGTPGGYVTSMEGIETEPVCRAGMVPPGCVLGNEWEPPDAIAADDFTVPAGPPWYVTAVHVDGRGGAGDAFSWAIVPVTGSLPSGPFLSNAFVTDPTTGSDDFDLPTSSQDPTAGMGLPAGHYWLEVMTGTPSTIGPGSVWEWQAQSPVTGLEGAWQHSPYVVADPNWKPVELASWRTLSAAGQPGPDLRFSIAGEVMDSSFGKLTIGKQIRRPAGGVVIAASISRYGKLALSRVAGKGKLELKLCCFAKDRETGGYDLGIKVKPLGKTKRQLKKGKRLRETIAVTYTIAATNGVEATPVTKLIHVLLKKVRHHKHHKHGKRHRHGKHHRHRKHGKRHKRSR